MKKWMPTDWIILILSFSISFAIISAMIKAAFLGGLDTNEEKILGGIISAVIAVISLYIGSKFKSNS